MVAARRDGVPLKTRSLSVTVAERDVDDLARWLRSIPNAIRWNPRWEDFDPGWNPDPRTPGEMRWWISFGDIRVSLVPELPEPVRIRIGDEEFPVRPLDQIADADPAVARVLKRVRARRDRAG
ncbi:MAG: hypothetical protein AUI14_02460 [Actinobacteria bacterium 13_2_20CM_2_71_6]|nr:MAG: hypothetical protein AUI14_02460 [Actinobacteria bacterium 13_2_20CM_2_71_6]